MAIRNMVRHLTDRPTARPVTGIELLRRQTLDGGSKLRWSGGDLVDPLADIALPLILSDRIVQVFHQALLRWGCDAVKGADAQSAAVLLNHLPHQIRES